jgi:hypothetical protein
MGLFDKFFPPKKTLYDKVIETATPLVINGYRQIARQRNCAPTAKTSDQKIIEIYQKVLTRFQEASAKKGEKIPAKTLNYIALGFMQVYETSGEKFMNEHLDYEIMKYHMQGLRKDYIGKEINLF